MQKLLTMKRQWKYGLAANVVKERLDENGVLRYGTKEFKGGTKIYLCGKYWDPDAIDASIDVIGLDRNHKYRVVKLETKYIENLRLDKVYKPRIYGLMNGDYFKEEKILIQDWWWSNTQEDKKQIEDFIAMWNTYRIFKLV